MLLEILGPALCLGQIKGSMSSVCQGQAPQDAPGKQGWASTSAEVAPIKEMGQMKDKNTEQNGLGPGHVITGSPSAGKEELGVSLWLSVPLCASVKLRLFVKARWLSSKDLGMRQSCKAVGWGDPESWGMNPSHQIHGESL